MKKIPTAEEFFNEFCKKRTRVGQLNNIERLDIMIEFAKLHVEVALESRDRLYHTHYPELNLTDDNIKFIKDSYPLENIK